MGIEKRNINNVFDHSEYENYNLLWKKNEISTVCWIILLFSTLFDFRK